MRLLPNDSNTVAAAVRAYLGISQTELGHWLGVSVSLVSDAEAGRKRFGAPASDHLRRLVQCLPAVLPPLAYVAPPAADAVPPALPATVAAPPPAGVPPDALRARLAAAVHAANAQRGALAQQHRYIEAAARWATALPGLTAAVPTLAAPTQARAARWLASRTAELAAHAAPGGPADPVACALAGLRAALLDAEAATLRQWLAAVA